MCPTRQRETRDVGSTVEQGGIKPAAVHIARVAARLFATQGYDATSVREIVEGAGVAKPTLYYYYRSKEGLAKALVPVAPVEPGGAACARSCHRARSGPVPGADPGRPF